MYEAKHFSDTSHLLLIYCTTQRVRYCYYPHTAHEKIEGQMG